MASSLPRQRDLLPLPLFEPDGDGDRHRRPDRAKLSTGAYRRQMRRYDNVCRANQAISAINSLAGCSEAKSGAPTGAQQCAMQGILQTMVERPRTNSTIAMREAVSELLHYRPSSAYGELEETGTTTVRPFQKSLISLPEPGAVTHDALDLVDEVGREILMAFHDTMLRDVENDPARKLPGDITPYMDVKLKASSTLYGEFIRDLWDRGMLDFLHQAKSVVTPFFVAKKSGRLRMVLDCRVSNAYFQDPPDIALPAGHSFSQLEIPDGHDLFIAQIDIRDYFYSIGMPVGLRPYFALPKIDLKIVVPDHPLCLAHDGPSLFLHPALKVVPMGWNWAMFIAQRVHQHQSMLAAGLAMERVLVDGRPSPDLAKGIALVPYADNLNIVGCSKEAVQQAKQSIVTHLESLGFRIHEEQEAECTAEALGFYIDGRRGRVYPKPEKLHKVRTTLLWLSRCPRVTGKMIERIIGHCIHFCMLRRELLSIFRAVYDFKVVAYEKRQRLWKTAGHEFLCMASLLDLCFADLRRPWSSKVSASDASLTGTAVCSSTWSTEQVQQVGKQRELWRFRAIGGAGRAREHVQALDPFLHEDTVKPSNELSAPTMDEFKLNLEFQEIPKNLLDADSWHTEFSAKMDMPEHITLLEGRGLSKASTPAQIRRKIADKTEEGRIRKRRQLMQEHDAMPRMSGQTFLEQSAISPKTAADYRFRMEIFTSFCKLHRISMMGAQNLDPSLTTFFQQCFNDGMELSEATKYLAAVMDSFPEVSAKHMLPTARRALKGWKNLDPGRSRPPLPWPLIALIALTMIEQGNMASAMVILTMFVTYSRPTETLKLQVKDLVSSTSLAATWMLVYNRSEEFETSKMGLADENITLDSKTVPWLGKALQRMSARLLPIQLLFQVEYAKLLTHWKSSLHRIGLPKGHCTPYQLRHSGASWDRFKNFRTQLEVKMRGRWESDSSMARYEKKALVSTAFDALPAAIQTRCHSAVQVLPSKALAILGQ
eukprot:s1915_g6.t1